MARYPVTDQIEALDRMSFRSLKDELRQAPGFANIVFDRDELTPKDILKIRRTLLKYHIIAKTSELFDAAVTVFGTAR